MLLELVLITSSHPFGSSFSEFEGYSGELGTCLSVVLSLTRLCEGAKLVIRVGTGLICQHCGDITGSNVISFTKSGARDVRANLSTVEDVVNAEVTKDLFCFIYDDGEEDKVSSGVNNFFGRETFSNVFFNVLVCDSFLKPL